jgi:hypothetical protein
VFKKSRKLKKAIWEILRSPKTIAAIKLGAAVVGVIHAIEELREAPGSGKNQIGFKPED